MSKIASTNPCLSWLLLSLCPPPRRPQSPSTTVSAEQRPRHNCASYGHSNYEEGTEQGFELVAFVGGAQAQQSSPWGESRDFLTGRLLATTMNRQACPRTEQSVLAVVRGAQPPGMSTFLRCAAVLSIRPCQCKQPISTPAPWFMAAAFGHAFQTYLSPPHCFISFFAQLRVGRCRSHTTLCGD